MSVNSIEFRQVRDFGSVLNATFAFIRENFKNILKVTLPVSLPLALIGGVITGLAYSKLFSSFTDFDVNTYDPDVPYQPWKNTMATLGMVYFGIFLFSIAIMLFLMFLYQYIVLYQQYPKNEITLSLVWQHCRSKIFPFTGMGIMVMIILLAGFLFFIIPGIYLTVPLSFVWIIFFAEGNGVFNSISRSFNIIKDNWWSSFGIIFILSILQSIISYVVIIPFYIVIVVYTIISIDKSDGGNEVFSMMGLMYSIVMPIYLLMALVSSMIPVVGLSFKYYSLVEEKEGIGMMEKIEKMDSGAANT